MKRLQKDIPIIRISFIFVLFLCHDVITAFEHNSRCCTFDDDECEWLDMTANPWTWTKNATAPPQIPPTSDYFNHDSPNEWLQNPSLPPGNMSRAVKKSKLILIRKNVQLQMELYLYTSNSENPPQLTVSTVDNYDRNTILVDNPTLGWHNYSVVCDVSSHNCCVSYPCFVQFKIDGILKNPDDLLAFDTIIVGNCFDPWTSTEPSTSSSSNTASDATATSSSSVSTDVTGSSTSGTSSTVTIDPSASTTTSFTGSTDSSNSSTSDLYSTTTIDPSRLTTVTDGASTSAGSGSTDSSSHTTAFGTSSTPSSATGKTTSNQLTTTTDSKASTNPSSASTATSVRPTIAPNKSLSPGVIIAIIIAIILFLSTVIFAVTSLRHRKKRQSELKLISVHSNDFDIETIYSASLIWGPNSKYDRRSSIYSSAYSYRN